MKLKLTDHNGRFDPPQWLIAVVVGLMSSGFAAAAVFALSLKAK